MTSVQARVVQYSRFGGAEVLDIVEAPVTDPAPGEVRVRMVAAGLNPADYKMRNGGPQYDVTLPSGIGRELAGTIEAVGADVTRLSVGDEVFGSVPDGALRDVLTISAEYFALKPVELSFPVAGSLALVGQTAWDALASQPLTSGDTIIVSAAAGGVGGVLAQLAVHRGIRVIGTASLENHPWLRSRGIEPIEYGPGVVAAVQALTVDTPVTAAFDLAGEQSVRQFVELGIPLERINTNAMDPSAYGIRRVGRGPTNVDTLERLAALVVAGTIEVPIAAVFTLDDVRQAFERLETRHLRGKIVVVA